MSAIEGEDSGREEGGEALASITARLEQVAAELDGELEPERAAELVREASELAARAGRKLEAALGAAAEARET